MDDTSSAKDSAAWFAELLGAQQHLLRTLDSATPMRAMMAWSDVAARGMAAAFWEPSDAAGLSDARFAADAWHNDPRANVTWRTYLMYAMHLRNAIDAIPVDARTKARWQFALRQVQDALSPANSLATNPEAVKIAIESGGMSLVDGMRLYLQDLAKGRMSITDEHAFDVGRDLARTPGSVVFENELMQLIQYAPTTPTVHERPLLIVPPCINKFYILDLQPENSLVAYAVAQGHTVFLVSWRNVSEAQGQLRWDDYVEQGVLKALDAVREISDAARINTLGFCIGGTLLSCALAVLAARGERRAASLTLLTTLLDFRDAGEIGLLVDDAMVALREGTIGNGGLLQGRELAHTFASLRANDLIWPYVVNGYLKGKAPPAFDLLFWNSDETNLPGPMFCWYLRNAYLENRLCVPGGTVQCGVPVDLHAIDVPAYVYASREDHIVPWRSAYASTHLLGGKTRFVLGASGHIAGVINPPTKNKRNYWTGAVHAEPPQWLDAAQGVPGSWWPDWSDWLATHAGSRIDAPVNAGSRRYPAIEAAPGRYVKEKAA
ncbi:class I poly(R)-hydroxyalkanoic acid synthase [Paraburkholderia flava]|uniref:class I poly(R)-hydroxyalkanoic acid synthase n=1 Tax=Paraburkholderia flava TaxID=2547393 RepID=UPI001F0CFA5C|nr:class I poly(R)-hydroxyalkanoic acid synthase [Paraburkholderia flava]